MFTSHNDLGASLFKTWTDEQRKDEIEKLVVGYRSGVPIGILCRMSETIAGNKKNAKKILKQLMTGDERKNAIESASAAMKPVVTSLLA